MSFVNNSRIPKAEMFTNQNIQPPVQVLHQVQQVQQPAPTTGQLPSAKDEDRMPLFLIKLWNIVEDPNYQQIIRWDESGYSFHIVDPYSFCRNVLPHYFKHNNLNSLIRQLNMYGFRKMSPLDKGGLTRSESDQDHLEFSHACFIRDRPDLLVNIKRKQSTRTTDTTAMSAQTQNNLQLVMDELRQLRDKQRSMDSKMHEITKENEALWENLEHVRTQHSRQQQVVTKLVQFLVAMVQPNLSKRVLKRGVMAIEEPPSKRARTNQNQANGAGPGAGGTVNGNLTEILDRLQRELVDNGGFNQQNYSQNTRGPIIADVTDEFGEFVHSPEQNLCATSPNGNVNSSPGSSGSTPMSRLAAGTRRRSQQNSQQIPMDRFDNGGRAGYQSGQQQQQQNGQMMNQQSRSSSKQQSSSYQQQHPVSQANIGTVSIPTNTQQQQQPCSSAQMNTSVSSFSPSITLSPSLDRQISQELQEYLNGVDVNIDSCRDLLSGQWDFDFLENLSEDDPTAIPDTVAAKPITHPHYLALEHRPSTSANVPDASAPVMQPHYPATPDLAHQGLESFAAAGDADLDPTLGSLYPSTPELLTPCTSPQHSL